MQAWGTRRMPKLKLLILDAGVVIKLHEMELWSSITDRCDVHLSSIVARRESKFHEVEDDAWGRDIDLTADIENETITIFEFPPHEVDAFKSQFDPSYFADLDDGEAESLAFLVNQKADYLISSGDAIVYKVLGNLNLGDQGISLEEILETCGLGRNIDGFQYSKAFREQLTRLGATDMVQGRGRKR
jgi:hypothetical protein